MIETDIPFLEEHEIEKLNLSFKTSDLFDIEKTAKVQSTLVSYQDYCLQLEIKQDSTSILSPSLDTAAFWAYYWVHTFALFSNIEVPMCFTVVFKSELWGTQCFKGEVPDDIVSLDTLVMKDQQFSLVKSLGKTKVAIAEVKEVIEAEGLIITNMVLSIMKRHKMSFQDAYQLLSEHNL